MAAAVLAAIAVGYVGWRIIEKPSMQFSKRVTLPRRAEPATVLTEPGAAPAR
jgi:hypothetical protein